jgi:hypothetical protein
MARLPISLFFSISIAAFVVGLLEGIIPHQMRFRKVVLDLTFSSSDNLTLRWHLNTRRMI